MADILPCPSTGQSKGAIRSVVRAPSSRSDDAPPDLPEQSSAILFFRYSSAELAIALFVVLLGATAVGAFLGHRVRHLSDTLKEPFGILQAALLGLVGLVLAFGLSLAVTRYENRRADVVTAANAIGTTYLRAQTLPEPIRSGTLDLLTRYARGAVAVSDHVPGSNAMDDAVDDENQLERRIWSLAGRSLEQQPTASAPRLYV